MAISRKLFMCLRTDALRFEWFQKEIQLMTWLDLSSITFFFPLAAHYALGRTHTLAQLPKLHAQDHAINR